MSFKIKLLWVAIEPFVKKLKQWKHYLPIINLFLLLTVVCLAIICVLLVYYPPVITMKPEKEEENLSVKHTLLPSIKTETQPIDTYELIVSNNPFSPNRTGWAPLEVKREIKQREEEVVSPAEIQPKARGTPAKITLRGILILGTTKKALIENPDQTSNKKPFIFVGEGEEVAEYKVKTIESDRVKLDWYGEEQVVVMRSNIKK